MFKELNIFIEKYGSDFSLTKQLTKFNQFDILSLAKITHLESIL